MELTPEQQNTLEVFTSKGGAFEVVAQIAKEHIEKKRETFVKNTMALTTDSNEEMGAKFRSFSEGIKLVDSIFRDIATYRKDPARKAEHNPAR